MAASTSFPSAKIVLNFSWQGPTQWQGGASKGGEEINTVDLAFKEAKTRISIHLPEDISPTTPQPFKFSCYRGSASCPTTPDSLSVTTEQVRNLSLTAIVLDKSPRQGNAIMDEFGKVTHQVFLRRSDQCIPLNIPEALEIGQTYRLIITSDTYLRCSAQLVKEEVSASEKKKQLVAAKNELLPILKGLFLPGMGVRVMEFAVRLPLLPSGRSLLVYPSQQGELAGVSAIKGALDQIDTNKLIPLLETVRSFQSAWASASPEERPVLEQKLFKTCCKSLGSAEIVNMMRANLESFIPGNIPPDVQDAINAIATRFKEQCMSRV